MTKMTARLYDKNRRPIEIGDILKVFHFVGARRKRHFMYKQAVKETTLGANKTPYLVVSHLDMQAGTGHEYYLQLDGSVLLDYEIVQSVDALFEDRARLSEVAAHIAAQIRENDDAG